VTEASLAIARKVVLCAGLLVAALLFLYPHWRVKFTINASIESDYGVGRSFIAAPPVLTPYQLAELGGFKDTTLGSSQAFDVAKLSSNLYVIDYTRQFVEVLLALLFTFGLMRALRKPAGDGKHDVEK